MTPRPLQILEVANPRDISRTFARHILSIHFVTLASKGYLGSDGWLVSGMDTGPRAVIMVELHMSTCSALYPAACICIRPVYQLSIARAIADKYGARC